MTVSQTQASRAQLLQAAEAGTAHPHFCVIQLRGCMLDSQAGPPPPASSCGPSDLSL